ncbi:hypothetical protein BHM03_00050297 [Ensete ventricosum]|nr:hypothetical protein BHM03_00050297 [Ensete ventricosum]
MVVTIVVVPLCVMAITLPLIDGYNNTIVAFASCDRLRLDTEGHDIQWLHNKLESTIVRHNDYGDCQLTHNYTWHDNTTRRWCDC